MAMPVNMQKNCISVIVIYKNYSPISIGFSLLSFRIFGPNLRIIDIFVAFANVQYNICRIVRAYHYFVRYFFRDTLQFELWKIFFYSLNVVSQIKRR